MFLLHVCDYRQRNPLRDGRPAARDDHRAARGVARAGGGAPDQQLAVRDEGRRRRLRAAGQRL